MTVVSIHRSIRAALAEKARLEVKNPGVVYVVRQSNVLSTPRFVVIEEVEA